MKNKNFYLNLLIAGMSLGTAWAVRGQFGHEQGAAWAGAIGTASVILLSRRDDWYQKLFKSVLAGAIGWGIGGIMSYGIVVGYGRGTDFANVYYGLTMLFVIGGLYGFIGGGLFGLALTDSESTKIKWHILIVEMVVGAIIIYFFFIYQFDWLMTPPRSELWAACLGMALALIWFIKRHKYDSALRVAIFAGLGGGFGFAFGNFLQVLGNITEIHFNFWNVMEYSIGFFGGLGLAYGTFTSEWPKEEIPQKSRSLVPLLLVVLVIPLIVYQQSFELDRLQKTYANIYQGNAAQMAQFMQLLALGSILFIGLFQFNKFYLSKTSSIKPINTNSVKSFFILHLGLYIWLSLLITGTIISTYRIEQYLYIVNMVVILLVMPKLNPVFQSEGVKPGKWAVNFIGLLIILAILALIAINIHGEMGGAQQRF